MIDQDTTRIWIEIRCNT